MAASRLRGFVFFVTLGASACADQEASAEREPSCPADGTVTRDGGVEYESTGHAIGATSAAPITLCNLARSPSMETAGLYRVETLTGYYEEDLWTPGSSAPFTYVELALLESWHGADGDAVARITGGPLPSCSTALWRVSLEVGEVVGVLLSKRIPENRDHYGLSAQGTFKQTQDGGYSNGVLFTREAIGADELGEMIEAIAESDPSEPCPHDAVPEGYRPPDTRE